jgi:hydroxysqualene synthase
VVNAFVAERNNGALADAYAYCEKLAREHYENFPVASLLLPAAMRPHIAAIYAFARTADDFADEPGIPDDERFRLLDDWSARLQQRGRAQAAPDAHADRVFLALDATIDRYQLPVQLLEDLLSAFRQDITVKRYATWTDLLDYCRRSANPVGRLVLRVAGYDDARLDAASDAVCTALQLTNFWQDLEGDWKNGRLYVPLEERDRAGARDEHLDAGRMTPEWQAALRAVTLRTRALFAAGRPVCDGVRGRLRWELRATWLGGSRILDKLEARGFDVFRDRPALGAADAPALLIGALRWTKQSPIGVGRHP